MAATIATRTGPIVIEYLAGVDMNPTLSPGETLLTLGGFIAALLIAHVFMPD